jgi:hypothetical protein
MPDMTIRQGLKSILLSGGRVSHPYKTKYADWFSTAEICALSADVPGSDPEIPAYWAHGVDGLNWRTDDIDEAIDAYCRVVFTPTNLWLVRKGAAEHGLGDMIFGETDRRKLDAIRRKYRDNFFAIDWPEFAGETA